MRAARILWAHVKANACVLRTAVCDALWHDPNHIKPPLLVYTKYSVEENGRKYTRQVGVGFWQRGKHTREWVDSRVYFKEEYQLETQTWKRTIPPQNQPSPASPTS